MRFFAKKTAPTRRNRPLEEAGVQAKSAHKTPVKLPFRFGWLIAGLVAVIGLGMVMANSYYQQSACKSVKVAIEAQSDNAFLTEEKVVEMLETAHGRRLIGTPLQHISLEKLEAELRNSPYIESAEVYKTLGGELQADLRLRSAVVRVFGSDGKSFYVDAAGHKFPASRQHSAHVPLLRGFVGDRLEPVDTLSGVLPTALPLLTYIADDPFWRAQVSEVYVDESGNYSLTPQVGDFTLEVGAPENLPRKFRYLRNFFGHMGKDIDWRRYKKISVKYRGQIVAQRR